MLTRNSVALIVMATVLLFTPFLVFGVGMEADMQCVGSAQCPLGKGPTGKCDKAGGGTIGKPCKDSTSGFTTTGVCVSTIPPKCQATGTSDGKLDPGMAKLGEMLGKLLEALMKGGGDKGGGGEQTPGQQCTTLQPTQDQSLANLYPNCYFYQPVNPFGSTTPTIYDPSGGLVANPMSGNKPLQVTFSYNNGMSECGTPPMFMDFGDGNSENLPVHSGTTTCTAIAETIVHTFNADGSYIVRMKNANTQAVKGGVTIQVGTTTSATDNPTPDTTGTTTNTTNTNGENTNITVTKTGGTTTGKNTNVSNTLFDTALNNLNNSGSVNNGGNSTGGNTFGSASTGGSNSTNSGAALNFDTPQSIVQSIIQKTVQPGAYGDVKILDNGTTIIAGNRGSNSEVVGFFGLSGKTSQSGGSTVQRLCTARPWATNFLSFVIPASFFDSLCTWRGYTVGTTATAPVTPTTTAPKTNPTTIPPQGKTVPKGTQPAATTTTNAPKTKVDIWASPATVPLGARTSVFWNTSNVQSCVETSPDGSFSHKTLQGGASTVPLTSPTTFTISCIGLDGNPYTDNVTVMIAI